MSNPNSNDQPSTLGSIVSGAAGYAQQALGSLTGSTTDKIEAEQRKQGAHDEYDASHQSAKLGSVNVSSSGATTVDNKDRQDGKWDQTIGSGKEFIGGLVGSDELKSAGVRQHDSGVVQEKQGQAADLVGGLSDRITGTVGGGVAKLTGNTQAQAAYQQQHDEGKTTQRTTEAEIQRQADKQAAADRHYAQTTGSF